MSRIIALLMAVALGTCSLAPVAPVYAHDPAHWGDIDAKTRAWVKGLRSPRGTLCCDIADAIPADEWDILDGQYRVRHEGEWLVVPPDATLTDGNRLGVATYWLRHDNGKPRVVCFLAGAGT